MNIVTTNNKTLLLLFILRAAYGNLLALWAIMVSVLFSGFALYSFYKNCDPWTAGQVSSPDQVKFMKFIDLLTIKNDV